MDTCGATLASVYYDAPYSIGTKTFRNWYANRGYMGYHNIREGIAYSMNILALKCLVDTVTPQLGVEYAEKLGITTLVSEDITPSLALGGLTVGVTNLELTNAFATIANEGIYTEPVFFTKILDHNGKVLIDNEPEKRQVIKDSTAFLVTDAMADSVVSQSLYATPGSQPSTTSAAAAIPGMSTSGKSGTTTGNNDLWFVGFTPYYTAGIWTGFDNNGSITGGTSYHKVIWRKIMTRIHEGLSDPGFKVPDSVEQVEVCRKSGKLPIAGVCSSDPRGSAVYTEYFAKGTAPTETCDHHVRVSVCGVSGGTPTAYCPADQIVSKTFMSVPDEGYTDDSKYAMPGPCTVHTGSSTIIDPSGGNGTDVPFGPGYIPSSGNSSPPQDGSDIPIVPAAPN